MSKTVIGRKIAQKPRCSSYVLQIRVVEIEISVAREILQKTVKSALLKVSTELLKNRVVSRTALLKVALLKDPLYIAIYYSEPQIENWRQIWWFFLNLLLS